MERRLDDADHRHSFEIEFAHCFGGGVNLGLAAVDHNQIRQSLFFITHAAITAQHRFVHRGKIVGAFDPANLEFAILVAIHLAVLANDHAGHVLRALNVRYVERFDARGKARQLERLLHLFEHALHVGLEHAKTLFESELGILLDQIDHVALFAALWREDVNAPPPTFAEHFFQKVAIVEIGWHMDLAGQE